MKFYDLYLSIIRDAVMRLSGGSGGPSVTVQPLAVTANGSYEAEDGTAYSPVEVNVRPNVVHKYLYENGLYNAADEHRDGFSVVDVDVREPFMPPAVDYPEVKDQVQSSYIKQLVSTPTGSTVTVRTGTSVSVAVGDKVLFDGTDAGTSLVYAAWGTVTSTRSYAAYRSVTLRIDGVSVRPTGETSIVTTGYGTHSVVGDLSVQVNANLEDVVYPTITENGQYTITPSADFDGLSSVTVDVNVSGGGGGGDDPVLTDLYASYDGTFTPDPGTAYRVITVDTGMTVSSPGERIPVQLNMPVNGTFQPSEAVAFSSVIADVHPAESGITVMDVTVYGDGVYKAADGWAFGTVTVVTTPVPTSEMVTVEPLTVTGNGESFPEYGMAYGEVQIDVSGGGEDTLGQLLAGTLGKYSNATLTHIPHFAFYRRSGVKALDFPAAESMGMNVFTDCDVSSVSIPSMKSLENSAFHNCTTLYAVYADAAESIGSGCFAECEALTEVNLPKCQTVQYFAFAGCTALTSLSLPAVTSIGTYVFDRCGSLAELHIGSDYDGVVTLESAEVFDSLPEAYTIYVPMARLSDYQADSVWSQVASHLQGE